MLKKACIDDFLIIVNNDFNIDSKIWWGFLLRPRLKIKLHLDRGMIANFKMQLLN